MRYDLFGRSKETCDDLLDGQALNEYGKYNYDIGDRKDLVSVGALWNRQVQGNRDSAAEPLNLPEDK